MTLPAGCPPSHQPTSPPSHPCPRLALPRVRAGKRLHRPLLQPYASTVRHATPPSPSPPWARACLTSRHTCHERARQQLPLGRVCTAGQVLARVHSRRHRGRPCAGMRPGRQTAALPASRAAVGLSSRHSPDRALTPSELPLPDPARLQELLLHHTHVPLLPAAMCLTTPPTTHAADGTRPRPLPRRPGQPSPRSMSS
jgi:hypothetical protein